MIVVAIIAILAAIAIPAYNQYIREARMAKVTEHYDNAIRVARAEGAKIAAAQARGNTTAALPTTPLLWIDNVIDPDNKSKAPEGGGPGYLAGASNPQGAIGIRYASSVMTVIRPAYLEITATSVSFNPSQQ